MTEYERLQQLFDGADERQRLLAEGAMQELARIRRQLDELEKIAAASGLVKFDPRNPARQRELPVGRALAKARASYIAYVQRLRSLLLSGCEDMEEDGLDEYE